MNSTLSKARWARLAITLALMLGLLAAACGGDDDKSGSGGSSDTTSGTETATPKRGGNVTYALEAETTGGWCLQEGQLAIAGIQVARTIYDTLMMPDDKGGFQPWLAESVEPNATYDEWTIKLKDGIKFHDGSDLTAEVVKNNLDAYRGQYPARKPLLFLFVFSNIDTVSVVDPLTVKVTTKVPWVAFPAFLWGSGRIGIMAQSQLDDTETCDRKLVGTGPFMLKDGDWKVNDHFKATRNPNWWYAKETGKPYPYLDSITYKPIIQGTDMQRALQAGDIDMGHFSQERVIAELRDLQESGDIKMDESIDNAEVGHVMLNASKPPFNDMDARLALVYALDREELNQLIYAGIGEPASGPFASGALGYLKDTGYPTVDVEKAKDLVKKYEAANGPLKFTLRTTSDPITQELAQTIQNRWKAVGMDVSLNIVSDQSQFINIAIGGDFQAITWRNFPGSDPDTQYVWWYNKDGDPAVNPVNFGRIPDKEIGKLLDAGRSEPDPAKRKKIYEDLNKRFAQQIWDVWGTWTRWAVATQPGINQVGGPFGPPFVSGAKEYQGLAVGQPTYQIWRDDATGESDSDTTTTTK